MTTSPILSLRITPAAEIDLAATVEVMNAAFRRHLFLAEDRTSLEGIVEELAPGCRFVQVFEGERLVGTASITPGATAHVEEHKFPGIDIPRSLYFGMAAVRPDRMGEGIGRRLVAESERVARAEGFDRIILTTIEEMGNVAYYGGFGYRSVSIKELPAGYWSLTIPTHEHGMAKELPRLAIREARPEEASQVADLVNIAYEVEDFFKVGPRTDTEDVASIIARHRFFVTEDAERLAACVYVTLEGGRGHFGMLSVHPEAQGKGFAKALIAYLERFCIERGCGYLDLEYVNLREELPAFYRRFGFEVTGEEPWPADELHRISRPAHFVTMSKALPPQGASE
ncbi:MAG: GNAT family N-acetyltransferase [Dehalococcoidia bacterium]